MHCDPEEGQTCNSRVVYTGARNPDFYKSKPNSFDLFLAERVWRQIISCASVMTSINVLMRDVLFSKCK